MECVAIKNSEAPVFLFSKRQRMAVNPAAFDQNLAVDFRNALVIVMDQAIKTSMAARPISAGF